MRTGVSPAFARWLRLATILGAAAALRLLPSSVLAAAPIICPFRRFASLECYGCGMTHAFYALVRGDLSLAIEHNGLILPWTVLAVGMIIRDALFLVRRRHAQAESRRSAKRGVGACRAGAQRAKAVMILPMTSRLRFLQGIAAACACGVALSAQSPPSPARPDVLRGEYGRYRANNDLLSYHLDVRVDPEQKFVSGKNTIRFRMLKDDARIQLDLYANLSVDRILLGDVPLKYEREYNAVFVDFPNTLKAGRTYAVEFHYSGHPLETSRFGAMAFRKDPRGRHWINTACEGPGAAIWWPNKDQWRDEVEHMQISVAVPNDLVDVSNGKFLGKVDLGDGYTRWDWLVQYPINNYNVSLNIGTYVTFSDRLDGIPMDFYVLPESLEKARRQFAQAKPMLDIYGKVFGDYPFKKDGYKLIEAPYSGMEHQSAVTYGNRFANGYLERDWTGVGVSTKFDFIIIHESAHEWFGNAVSAADVSDMWIHEGWGTYLEAIYVERMFGPADALKYINGYKTRVANKQPIIPPRGVHRSPPQDQYFKGALFIHTLRSIVNDDPHWWKLLREFYQRFKYRNIMTEDVVRFFNEKTKKDLTPVFDQYLRHTALPTLELRFAEGGGTVSYRWKADVPGFTMPVRVGRADAWQVIHPTVEWQSMPARLGPTEFDVATHLYYVNVSKALPENRQ